MDGERSEMSDVEDEVVWGAKAIGEVVNRSPRQVIYLLENGTLPAKKIRDQWVSTRQKLLQAVTPEAAV
jgi:hypothetical protein